MCITMVNTQTHTHTDRQTAFDCVASSSAVAERPLCRVGQFWPTKQDYSLQILQVYAIGYGNGDMPPYGLTWFVKD